MSASPADASHKDELEEEIYYGGKDLKVWSTILTHWSHCLGRYWRGWYCGQIRECTQNLSFGSGGSSSIKVCVWALFSILTVERGVSLSIKRGEFVVVFGLSGGGKTTLLNIIGTIDKPTKGELYLCGHRSFNLTMILLTTQESTVIHQMRSYPTWG